MIDALDLEFLHFLPPVFLVIALAAWGAAFGGLAHDLARRHELRGGRLGTCVHFHSSLLGQVCLRRRDETGPVTPITLSGR